MLPTTKRCWQKIERRVRHVVVRWRRWRKLKRRLRRPRLRRCAASAQHGHRGRRGRGAGVHGSAAGLGVADTLLGSLAIPFHRRITILRYAFAVLVHASEVELSLSGTLLAQR